MRFCEFCCKLKNVYNIKSNRSVDLCPFWRRPPIFQQKSEHGECLLKRVCIHNFQRCLRKTKINRNTKWPWTNWGLNGAINKMLYEVPFGSGFHLRGGSLALGMLYHPRPFRPYRGRGGRWGGPLQPATLIPAHPTMRYKVLA